MIEAVNCQLSIQEQCSLIDLSISSYYYHPLAMTEEDLEIMASIDRIYTDYPFYGLRKITDEMRKQGS